MDFRRFFEQRQEWNFPPHLNRCREHPLWRVSIRVLFGDVKFPPADCFPNQVTWIDWLEEVLHRQLDPNEWEVEALRQRHIKIHEDLTTQVSTLLKQYLKRPSTGTSYNVHVVRREGQRGERFEAEDYNQYQQEFQEQDVALNLIVHH